MKTLINKLATICFCFCLSLQLHAQDIIQTHLTGNAVLNEAWNERKDKKNLRPTFADTIEIDTVKGLVEDFSYPGPYPDPAVWLDSSVYVNRTYPYAPPTLGVATFDGLDKRGYPYDFTAPQNSSRPADFLTSRPINLAKFLPSDSMNFSFYYQPQGRGNAPASRDSLVLEFKAAGSTVWSHIWAKPGSSLNMKDTTNWGFVMIPVKADYLKKGFQFRFRNYATVSGSLDHWHIDFVHLGPSSNKLHEEAAFVYQHPSFLKTYQVMPWRQYDTSYMKFTVILPYRNNFTIAKNIQAPYKITDQNGAPFYDFTISKNGVPFLPGGTYVLDTVTDTEKKIPLPKFPKMNGPTTYLAKAMITPAPDYVLGNNTLLLEQKFSNYFAYDDGTAESAFALNTLNAQFAMKFQLTVQDTLRYVDIYFNPLLSDASLYTFNLKVWSDGGGVPGAELATSRNLSPRYSKNGLNTIIRYGMDDPLILPPGVFYVGYMQNTNNSLGVGLDLNTNNQLNSFYNNGTGWNTSPIAGSAIIHPVFGKDSSVVSVSELRTDDKLAEVYPNPATTELHVRSSDKGNHKLNYSVMDAYGRMVESKTLVTPAMIDITNYAKGIYFIRVSEENRISTIKFIKIE